MGFYNGTAMDVLCQQIMRDNPNVAGKLSPSVVFATGPAVARAVDGRNTQVTLAGYPGKGFLGEITFSYDRIAMPRLFAGAAAGPVTIPYRVTTRAQMLPYLNDQLGLNLTVDDIANPDILAMASTTASATISVVIQASSICYSGTLSVALLREDPAFVDLYLPANGVNGLWRNPAPAAAVWAKSFQPYVTQVTNLPKNVPLRSNTSMAGAFLNVLRYWSGIPFELNATLGNGDYDLTDAIATLTTTRLVPDANQNYTNVVIITPTPGKHRWTVPLYIHYTPKVAETITASQDDFNNYAVISGNPVVRPDESIRDYASKSVIVDLGEMRDSDVYYGNVWGKDVYAALSGMHRVAQHCFPNKATFDYALANKLKVMLTMSGLVTPTTAYNQTARNGYTSLFYTQAGGTSGIRVISFTYFDNRYGNMRTLNPNAAPAETTVPNIWLP